MYILVFPVESDALNFSVLEWMLLQFLVFFFIRCAKWFVFCCLHNMVESSGKLGYNES